MKKKLYMLGAAVIMSVCLFASQALAAAVSLIQPSGEEAMLAPQRDFVIIGRLEDIDVPADVRVELFDNKNKLLRRVTSQVNKVSGITDKEQLKLDYEHGKYYLSDNNESLIANPPPDIVAGSDGKRLNDPTNKAVVNREREFAALILGGVSKRFDTDYSDAELGNYHDLKPGRYMLKVTAVNANDGTVLAELKQKMTLVGSENIVFGRFSPDQSSGYAHKEKLFEFAAAGEARLLRDSLPGYWSRPATGSMPEVFYEIPLRWRLNDAKEYLSAKKVHGVIYNISEGSATQSVEIGSLIAGDYIDNPLKKDHKVNLYYYDIGDVDVEYLDSTGRQVQADGKIVPFPSEGEKYRQHMITRVEIRPVAVQTLENDYWPKDSHKYVDFDITDGVAIKRGEYISLYGVTAPIRTNDYARAKDDDVFTAGSYVVNNRIMNIKYTIITPEGARIEVMKPVGLKRHYFVNKIARSMYEYKHILGSDVFSTAGKYTVGVVGCDKNGQAVDRTAEEFNVVVK